MKSLKLKICGMKYPNNIEQVIQINPDFIGFIFYEPSARYVDTLPAEEVKNIPKSIDKVGVFVNASFEEIMEKVEKFGLDAVQLHGEEDLSLVKRLKKRKLIVIKVFRVEDELPQELEVFENWVDYFLFDTKSIAYGGTGLKFDWSILERYSSKTPYLLSGGISIDDVETIKAKKLPKLFGIDVNSKFEIKPGMKDVKLLKQLKNEL